MRHYPHPIKAGKGSRGVREFSGDRFCRVSVLAHRFAISLIRRSHRGSGKVFTDTGWAPWFMATMHPSAILRVSDRDLREKSRQRFIDDLKIVAKEISS